MVYELFILFSETMDVTYHTLIPKPQPLLIPSVGDRSFLRTQFWILSNLQVHLSWVVSSDRSKVWWPDCQYRWLSLPNQISCFCLFVNELYFIHNKNAQLKCSVRYLSVMVITHVTSTQNKTLSNSIISENSFMPTSSQFPPTHQTSGFYHHSWVLAGLRRIT